MVVLDAVLEIQRSQAKDLAVRWNCKAAKCGSCSAEINGRPRLMCKTRLDHLPEHEPITVEPIKAFPVIRDLVTDVSWNYEVNKRIPPFTPSPTPNGRSGRRTSTGSPSSASASSASSARTCATSSATTVCTISYFGPRFLVRIASLEMHPLDTVDRTRRSFGRGRPRPLQHHEVLHRGLPRGHPHHRQRDHPAEGARRRPPLRPAREAPPQDRQA